MRIFIIGPVRKASPEMVERMNRHVKQLESAEHHVYLPARDTKQNERGSVICHQNAKAISESDQVHLFYVADSQGVHFDMGLAFAFNKPIRVIFCPEFGEGKSFPRMAHEWQRESD